MPTHASMELGKLEAMGLTTHVKLLVEDWNEPDQWEAGHSTLLIMGDTIFVSTPVRMRWDAPNGTPGRWLDSLVVCSYQDEEYQDVVVFTDEGKIGYSTGTH